MLLVHDILVAGEGPTTCLVLWVDPGDRVAALIDQDDKNAMPYLVHMHKIASRVELGVWTLVEGQMPASPLDHELTETERRGRDKAHEVVRFIVEGHAPGIFEKGFRAQRIGLATKAFSLSRPTVTGYLRRYFLGGMCPGALVPRYKNSGAPGQRRVVRPGAPKRGRPPAEGHPIGCNVTEELRRVFRLSIDASYARERKHDLMSAYRFCIRKFLSEEITDQDTGRVRLVALADYREVGLPTKEQFVYWAGVDHCCLELAKRREGARSWEMTNKPKIGTSTSGAFGPGSRFQIDATVLDLYVRSRADRRRLVGRPTLYVVIDVFSRMIVGIYIGLEHPSWVAAMMALANAVEEKVGFCARFGIDIEAQDWPAQHICGTLLSDGGELSTSGIDAVLRNFNMTVETHAPYRADWKGVVESRFKTLQMAFKPYTDGYVQEDFKKRGGSDYREDAVLDIDDISRVVIHLVIFYNNSHELVDYPRHKGQVADGVKSIPIELWEWGLATRSGSPRRPNIDRFKFALMPISKASVTAEGLYFQGRYYSFARAIQDHWFTQARRGRFDVAVSYDKRDVDRIYVHDRTELGYDVATLTERSVECATLSGWEVADLHRMAARMSAGHRDEEVLERARAEADIVRTVERARAEFDRLPAQGSAASQVKGARSARAEELAADRPGEVARTRPPGASVPTHALEIGTSRPSAPPANVSTPSMAEILRSMRAKGG